MLAFHSFERGESNARYQVGTSLSHTTQQTAGVEAAAQTCDPAAVLLPEKAAAHSPAPAGTLSD